MPGFSGTTHSVFPPMYQDDYTKMHVCTQAFDTTEDALKKISYA